MYIANVASDHGPATPEDVFGRQLRRLREEHGLTQADLAKLSRGRGVDLHPSAIAKIEARDAAQPRAIRLNEAVALAATLGRSVEDLTLEQAALWGMAEDLIVRGLAHLQESDKDFARALDILKRAAESGGSDDTQDFRANVEPPLEGAEFILEAIQQTHAELRTRIDGEHSEAP